MPEHIFGNASFHGDVEFLGNVSGIGGGDTYTTENLNFPIDYVTGIAIDAGTIFTSQTEIDDYLTGHSATHFKYLMDCIDSLPHYVYHQLYFNMSPGVHRPRPAEPAPAAWYIGDYPGHPRHHEFVRTPATFGGFIAIGSLGFAEEYWEDVLPAEPVLATQNSPTYDRYIDVAAATYTPGALRGKWARIDSSTFPILIRDNTDSRIYLGSSISGSPTTVAIQKPGITLRNSYDDVNPAVDGPLFYVETYGFLQSSLHFNLEGIVLEQYAQSKPVLQTYGRIYHDFFFLLCDQAQLLDDGIDSRGYFIQANYSGFHGQLWRCTYRSQRDSIVAPTGSSQTPLLIEGQQNERLNGRLSFPDNVWRGVNQSSAMKGMILVLNNAYFANFSVPPMQFTDCDLSSSSHVIFENSISTALWFNDRNRINGSFQTYFESIGDSTGDHLFYVAGFGNFLNLGSVAVVIGPSGPSANLGRSVYFSSGSDNKIFLGAAFTDGALSNAGDLYTPQGEFAFSDLGDLRGPAKQPDGAMAGIVRILQMSDGLTHNSTKNLAFTTTGNLLSYDGGTGVDISGLGVFMLVGPGGDWVVVSVAAVPGSNQTFAVTVNYRPTKDYRGNVLYKTAG